MNSKNYAENVRKMIKIIFALIDLKREIEEDTVFVIRAKADLQNAFRKRNIFD